MFTQKMSVAVCVVALLIVPVSTQARTVDVSDLDDDISEDISVPVLFGIDYKSLIPDFGQPRGGGTRLHLGQDMVAPKGTPIVSPTEAVVLSTGDGESSGLYVYTANPGGESYRYMHLDEIADIKAGDKLDAGDFIGTVGDTGNAPDGVYHLHFEIRQSDREYADPHTRFGDEFTTKEKMSFVSNIFREIDDEEEYAEFLVSTYSGEFLEAREKGYSLPEEIEEAMEDTGLLAAGDALAKIKQLLAVVPQIVTADLTIGDNGPMVQLVQLYLMFHSSGQALDRLSAAGATGYYGAVTQAAVLEYQANEEVRETGVYDAATRTQMSN